MKKRLDGIIFLAGIGSLALLSKKRVIRSSTKTDEVNNSANQDSIEHDVHEKYVRVELDPGEYSNRQHSRSIILSDYLDPEGRVQLGGFYQIKYGDNRLEVCMEALFGSRTAMDPAMVKAASDLLVRIDCSPWNQANYGVPMNEVKGGHNSDSYFTQRGISFDPIYSDNKKRMSLGLRPTSAPGSSHAMIWVPMINPIRFDSDGTVTTEGMNYPDTEKGMGGSMIDPPSEILDLGFSEVSAEEVGCDLPEGNFRRSIVAN